MRRSKSASVCLVLAALFVVGVARADGSLALERAKNSYDAGRYEEGIDRFREVIEAGDALDDPLLLQKARAYYAACFLAVGRSEEADAQLELILQDDPAFRPDPVIFPGKLVDRFTAVRLRIQSDLEARASEERRAEEKARLARAEYIRSLELLAREEIVVARNSRWVAALPFGAGQFQNGQTALGWVLLTTEALAAGASIASFVGLQSLSHDAARAPASLRATYNDDLRAYRLGTNVSFAVFAGLAATGILHAQLTFVPEVREVRERTLPQAPASLPLATMVPGGAIVGWTGAF